MKYLLILGGLTLAAALSLAIDDQSSAPAQKPITPLGPVHISAPGRVEGVTREIHLRPRVAGAVVELPATEGALLKAGDVLLQLDRDAHQQELRLAEAELELAQAKLERLQNGARAFERREAEALCLAEEAKLSAAQLAWNRSQQLQSQRAVSQQQVDDQYSSVRALEAEVAAARARVELLNAPAREDEVQMARAEIQAARARVELARVQLQRTTLRAPVDAQVLAVNVDPGELTGPEASEAAVTLADTSRLQVRAYVEELDAPRVEMGMAATVTADGLPGMVFRGRVTRLSPRMAAKRIRTDDAHERLDTKTREVWIELESHDGLLVGLPVDVLINPEKQL